MTPSQRDLILESLRVGCSLETAARSAHVKLPTLQSAITEDDDFAEAIEQATAEGGAEVAKAKAELEQAKPKPPTPPVRKLPPVRTIDDPEPEDEDEPESKSTLDGDAILRESQKFASGPMGLLLWQDSKLTAAGQPPMSQWWRYAIRQWLDSGRTWGVFLVGRGAGKSTTLERIALMLSILGPLFWPRKVPPGQRWIWPFLSATTTDASRRISETAALLRAIGIEAKPKGTAGHRIIELVDVSGNDVSFDSIAATVAGVSGPSALGAIVDEEAKLKDKAQHVNPATEVLASIAQMSRGRDGFRGIRCSSAWRELGSHWLAVAEGDTEATHVARIGPEFLDVARNGFLEVALWEQTRGNAEAAEQIRKHAAELTADSPMVPTWVGNPTISAVKSREIADATPPDAGDGGLPRWRVWMRENGSVPVLTGPIGVASIALEDLQALARGNRGIASASTMTRTLDGYTLGGGGELVRGTEAGTAGIHDPRNPRHGFGGPERSL